MATEATSTPSFTMRTPAEIVQRMGQNTHDIFGFEADVLAPYLTAEQAKPFCKTAADLSEWEASPLTRDAVVAEMRDYMAFAWDKASDHRGLSAGRSVQKLAAWLWILGDDAAVAYASDSKHYPQYGAPVLLFISLRYGFDVPDDEDLARMAQGKRCTADYSCGCNS